MHTVLRRNSAVFGQALAGVLGQHEIDHRQCNRDHHRGGGGIGYPHAEHCGSEHESRYDAVRPGAHQRQGTVRDAPVQAPALDRRCHNETAKKQEYDTRCVGRRGGTNGRDTEHWKNRDR